MLRSSTVISGCRRLSSGTVPVTSKKTHRLRRFLLKVVVGSALFYGGGMTLSAYNPRVNDLFTENVPYAEELMDIYDNYRRGLHLSGPTFEVRRKLDELRRFVRSGGVKQEEEWVPGLVEQHKKVVATAVPELEPLKQQKLEKLLLPEVEVNGAQAAVQRLIDSLNSTIALVNERGLEVPEESAAALRGTHAALSQGIHLLNESVMSSVERELSARTSSALEELTVKYESEIKSKELEISEKYMNDFESFKRELEKITMEQLQTELKAHEQALLAKQRNEIAQLSIRQVEEFNKVVKEKIDQERQGRLAKLQELDAAVNSLVPVLERLEKQAVKKECVTQMTLAVQDLQTKLAQTGENPVDLSPELEKLKLLTDVIPRKTKKCCSSTPELMDIVVAELESKASGKIASNEQLYNRWLLLQPELKTTSLLPPNAGFLGHLTAKIFSLLLFTKEGFSTTQDMDATIARVAENLRVNKLDQAVAEAVEMKGWSRKVADGWVKLARQRLEVLSLVDVINAEIKTL
ncbi:Mic60p Ecym_6329 [Eremothecium cymbalariae DBVPG|uniref:MICOS complex subunit MIC60 n=1 Tax=Eremothecium cymbalariae (strain CBS 270.75 / DBVPG 7215 / KCTC 17166 / NRRL Y-17582) TaxID=931890 RepID=G8JUC5_ERECY|nr:hypothetical protein Ecym_6329 [Eremothecium cymbalariae DBVPG\